MRYTEEEVYEYVEQEDVKFIRLSFCDGNGKQKNVSIMPGELKRAFSHGISFDASAVAGFGEEVRSDLLLFPNPSTLNVLPWRPSHGKVVRMFCNIRRPDGTPFEMDARWLLQRAEQAAADAGVSVRFGTEYEFYLFRTDENQNPTSVPFDNAGYMDVAPEDRGENVRREICLTLLDMGIQAESSHHEEGPGQNEIDFRYSDPMTAADNAMHFISVVKATAHRNGLYADFSPKPIAGKSGNGLHLNLSVTKEGDDKAFDCFMAGIMEHVCEITAFLNPTEDSYRRLGEHKAPCYVSWSKENRSQLIRIPAACGEYRRMELRSPDPTANPYLCFALLIFAGLDGVSRRLVLPPPVDCNLYRAGKSVTGKLRRLPADLSEARKIAWESAWLRSLLPEGYFRSENG